MNLLQIRNSIKQAIQSDEYSDPAIDWGYWAAGHELMRQVPVAYSEATKNLTPHDNEVDLSTIDGFRSERCLRAEIGYNDRGTWVTGSSYAVNDLVIGDGTPDSKLYVCTEAHTADSGNEPPSEKWKQTENRRGTRMDIRTYDEVVDPHAYTDSDPYFWPYRDEYQGAWYDTSYVGQGDTPDRPRVIGFANHKTAYVRPTPPIAYPLRLTYRESLHDFTIGQPGAENVTSNIPDEYLPAVTQFGAPAYIEYPDPSDRASDYRYQRFVELIEQFKGVASPQGHVLKRRPNFNGL